MTRPTSRPCPHDLRPGTTVCLHCRREANLEARARMRHRVFRVSTTLAAVAVVAVAVALLGVRRSAAVPVGDVILQAAARVTRATRQAAPRPAVKLAGRVTVAAPAQPASITAPAPASPAVASIGTPAAATPGAASAKVAMASAPAAPVGSSSTITPVIPEGRHAIDAEVFAERVGDTVIVHFDTPETRTRRPEKFERTVRRTLPAVYGPLADSMLAAIPDGQLTAGGDLLTELPTQGIRLTAPNGAAVTLWPETRPGEDGPLVVTYRVEPTR